MIRWLALSFLLLPLLAAPSWAGVAQPTTVVGMKKLLVVAVRFKGVEPDVSLHDIADKASKVARYIGAASYEKVKLSPRVVGWYVLPGSVADYQVSPYNYQVDGERVRKLLSKALGAARANGVNLADYDQIWIDVGVRTRPGKGYGMIAYCANPGMLSGHKRKGVLFGYGQTRQIDFRNEEVDLAGGGSYAGPAVVSAENSHVGHVAHDLLHALGGTKDGKRVVPDLYDFYLQSHPPAGVLGVPATFATYVGPWGIMSEHFIRWHSPPPQPTAFTRIQLGWIGTDQIVDMRPGEDRRITLSPLSTGKGTLAVRIRLSASRYLVLENRQPILGDAILPSHGLIVSLVNVDAPEGGGIVKVVDATPATKTLDDAPYVPGDDTRNVFVAKRANTAVFVQSKDKHRNLRLVVTTPGKVGGLRR